VGRVVTPNELSIYLGNGLKPPAIACQVARPLPNTAFVGDLAIQSAGTLAQTVLAAVDAYDNRKRGKRSIWRPYWAVTVVGRYVYLEAPTRAIAETVAMVVDCNTDVDRLAEAIAYTYDTQDAQGATNASA
jgi:hypothetical protein